jgi:hypothetical protein
MIFSSPFSPLRPGDGAPRADDATIVVGDPRRAAAETFVAQVYRARYGARLTVFMPQLLAWRDDAGALRAVVGLRHGGDAPLFVEQYLDVPADAAVAAALGRAVAREALVEVGNFAACSAGDARAVIVHLTERLHAAGVRWVLFAATRQLRNAFDRLHLATVELADADPARLGEGSADWGTYYDAQPKLMFGDVAAGHAYLRRSGRLRREAPVPSFQPQQWAGAQ